MSAAPFASPTIFLFIGTLIIGLAVSTHQLDRRLACSLLSLKMVHGNIGYIRIAIGLMCMAVSASSSMTLTESGCEDCGAADGA